MIYNRRDYARLRNGVLLGSAIAWGLLFTQPQAMCRCQTLVPGAAGESLLAASQLPALAMGWALMLVAMMAPTLIPALYHVQTSSFAHRRWRSLGLFIAGYGLVWMVAGVDLQVVALAIPLWAPGAYAAPVVVVLVAVLWQMSPFKQRLLNRCHSHRPIAAFGLAADKDVFRLGLAHGVWCVGSCWAAMLLPLVLPAGHFAAMLAVSVLMFCERLDPPRAPAWRWRGFGTALRHVRLRWCAPRTGPVPLAKRAGA